MRSLPIRKGIAGMSLSERFPAYACLKDIAGASEGELTDWLSLSVDEEPVANYEDAVLECLISWLRAVTGVPWVRGFEDGARPSGQYGTVCILRTDSIGCKTRSCREFKGDLVETISQPVRISVQLDAYRDSGRASNCEESDAIQKPLGSAPDVLNRLRLRMCHQAHRDALADYGLSFDGEGIEAVNTAPTQRQNDWEWRASADFALLGTQCSTMRVNALRSVPLELDGKPICEPKILPMTEDKVHG